MKQAQPETAKVAPVIDGDPMFGTSDAGNQATLHKLEISERERLVATAQECPCMPGLVWYAGDPDECAGKRERAAWDRCVGFEVNATGAARPGKGCVVVPGSNNKAACISKVSKRI